MNIDRKILACVDTTPMAEVVTDYATWAARRLDAPVELLHVLERHVELSDNQDHSGAIGLDAQEKLMDRLTQEDAERTRSAREQGRVLLSGLRERAEQGGATTVDSRLRHGDIEETLAEQQEGSRLLIIGRNGHPKRDAKTGLGQHLEWVVRSATRPVLVVTEAYREPKSVLFAFDGSSVTRKGVDMLAGSPLLRGLKLQLLTAGEPGAAEQKSLDAAVASLVAAGIDATASTRAGSPKEVVADALATGGFDMLVMGAYSHSPLRSLLFGSKTTDMLTSTCVPTLLLR
ncbi:universal stress protein [Denitromonas ohlonensis]|uniref:Universal stress protein n=2 Tax=Denitromonas TaxID=139331 RepID=A0A557S6K4_9RHOO|nr:universal stress protein [Denitromonas ohlonensis]TVO63969.1 universal stress protein [Denitromonas ohlonensis]TVO73045.1 universal stress protein [Denitromonas ohlonensis]